MTVVAFASLPSLHRGFRPAHNYPLDKGVAVVERPNGPPDGSDSIGRPCYPVEPILSVVCFLSDWPRTTLRSTNRNIKKSQSGAAAFLPRFWSVLGLDWDQGYGYGKGLGWVGSTAVPWSRQEALPSSHSSLYSACMTGHAWRHPTVKVALFDPKVFVRLSSSNE